jgi:hypothetical protein
MKVSLYLDDIKRLRDHAIRAGTLLQWSKIAIEWMEQAQKKIEELQGNKNETH